MSRRVVRDRVLDVEERLRSVLHDPWNPERAAEVEAELQVVVRGRRRIRIGERVRRGVPGRVAERDVDAAVVERGEPRPIVAERARLRERRGRTVDRAAVDDVRGFWRRLLLDRGRRRPSLPGRRCGGLPDDLAERLHRQRHDGRRAVTRHDDLAARGNEAAHLDPQRPRAVVDLRDREGAVVGRERGQRPIAASGGHDRARNTHAGERDAAGQIARFAVPLRRGRRPQQHGDHRDRDASHRIRGAAPAARAGGLPAKASATAGLFGVGRSTRSTTIAVCGPFVGSSFNPSCCSSA